MSKALTRGEVLRVVNLYVGVSGGYLGDFSYRTHEEFYPIYCDLTIDPYEYEGTTRQRFISIILAQPPQNQAKILRGVLEKYPVGSTELRTEATADEIRGYILRIESGGEVESPEIDGSESVQRALQDAVHLIEASDASSAVDRVHTAIHGYLRGVCIDASITHQRTDSAARLLRVIHREHPAFGSDPKHAEEMTRIANSLGNVLDALGTLRNRASLAHANEHLLDPAEAMLAVNSARSVLTYVDTKLQAAAPVTN